jgi:hypothetical protein
MFRTTHTRSLRQSRSLYSLNPLPYETTQLQRLHQSLCSPPRPQETTQLQQLQRRLIESTRRF